MRWRRRCWSARTRAAGRHLRGEGDGHRLVSRRPAEPFREKVSCRAFVGRVGVGVEEAYRHALHPGGGDPVRRRRHRFGVERLQHLPVVGDALVHLEDRPPRHEGAGLVEPEVVGVEALGAAHDEHVPESASGHEGGAPSLTFQDGVGRDGRRDQDLGDVREPERADRGEPIDALQGGARRVGGGAEGLREPRGAARLVTKDEVGERAAGVDCKPQHGPSPVLSRFRFYSPDPRSRFYSPGPGSGSTPPIPGSTSR